MSERYYQKLTPGEREVWAATYAAAYHHCMIVKYVGRDREETAIAMAIEQAGGAVSCLRKAKRHIEEGWKDCDTLDMYLDIVEGG